METMIEFQHIRKSYGTQVVLNDFQLSIEKGAFVTMIGSSGCGKTTALKLINGLLIPDEGTIRIEGTDIQTMDQNVLRRNIGYAIQGSVLFPHMSVEQNIAYVPSLLNRRDRQRTRDAVDQWMKIVHLPQELKDRYPWELSGGQQQRVGIARALAASPDILLMDEPFGAVDSITRTQLQKEIKAIHEDSGITIVFVTHDINEALYLGTRVLVMDQGAIQQYDTPDQIRSRPATDFVRQLISGAAGRRMNNLAQLHIDRTKCSGCGRCVQVCPGSLFFLDPSHHAAHHPIERFGWTGCERSLLNGWTHWLPVGSIQMAMTQKAFRISSGPKRPYDRICCFAALPTC